MNAYISIDCQRNWFSLGVGDVVSGFWNGRRLPRRDEVFDNLRWLDATFPATSGKHTLKLIMIDPEIVVEQIVVNPDNNRYSYFGNSAINTYK